jgi:hypothetical protein
MIKVGTGSKPDATLTAAMHTYTTGIFLWRSLGKFILASRAEEFGMKNGPIR